MFYSIYSLVFDLFVKPDFLDICDFSQLLPILRYRNFLNCFNMADTNMNCNTWRPFASNARCHPLCGDRPCPSHSYAVPITALSDTVAVLLYGLSLKRLISGLD